MNFKGKMCEKSGITLITLVVTIIILLILAGITIATITSDNGIIKNANDAKEQTEIAEEKEIVDRATIQAMGNNKRGNLVQDELQEQLDKITDTGKTEVSDNGEEFEVVFVDSNRYYTVDKDGNIIEEGKIVVDKSPGDITKDENGDDIEEGQPYEIWCIEDLIEWSNNYAKYQNANINLCTNLNFKSKYSYANSERTDYGDINNDDVIDILIQEMQGGIGFLPIESFKGTFNGSYYKINNIFINQNTHAGFIKNLNGAKIKNLSLEGIIEATGDIGGIVTSGGGIIENCHTNLKINTSKETKQGTVGGIIGVASTDLEIINCSNNGKINGHVVGGIVGWCWQTGDLCNILNSYNLADINGNTVGGILGLNTYNTDYTKIYNCLNIGMLNGNNKGGIVGNIGGTDIEKVKIYNSYYLNNVEKDIANSYELQAIKFAVEDLKEQIDKLNEYIENSNEVDTSLWKYWKLGEDGTPTFE